MHLRYISVIFMALVLLAGCAATIEKPVKHTTEEPRPPLLLLSPDMIPSLVDDLGGESIGEALAKSIRYYEIVGEDVSYGFGSDRISARDMKESLLIFQEIIGSVESDEMKQKKLKEMFDIYKATGFDGKGAVLFTGYFEPVMEGSLERTEEYRHPLYRTPDDVVVVNLSKFGNRYKNDRIIGRLQNRELIPYYTRADIDGMGSLTGKNLEIAWVNDPIDLFFLHIQGSGKIRLPDGRFAEVGYDQWNGRPYRSIGKYLLDRGKLLRSELTHQAVKKYLRDNPEERSDIMNYNESYVFFRVVKGGPVGALNLSLTEGRSIATDLNLFPKGALALIRLRKPIFDDNGTITKWETFSRFVFNQDTGGAIKGPGRVDLFCGTGSDAEMIAGSLKEKGELYFLVRKKGEKK